MNSFQFVLPFLLVASCSQLACASERIIDVREKREVTREEFLSRIEKAEELIVGEKHDTTEVQDAEARLFADFARLRPGRTTFAWEFWSWSEKAKLDGLASRYFSGELGGDDFLKGMFGEKNPEKTYLPLMEAVKTAGADVLPTNLTRAEKAPVVKDGIEALDPQLLPPGFALGGAEYYERFVNVMAGHGDPATYKNYFAAQCLVDDVAAFHFLEDRKTESAFLVIGDFHVRYFDGLWKRLEIRNGARSRLLVQISNASDESDWDTVMNHPKYGPISDFLILL